MRFSNTRTRCTDVLKLNSDSWLRDYIRLSSDCLRRMFKYVDISLLNRHSCQRLCVMQRQWRCVWSPRGLGVPMCWNYTQTVSDYLKIVESMSSLSFSTAQGKTFSSFLSINIPGDGNLSVRSLEDHRVTVIPCDFVCTSSGNEVCGCEGWEKHVLVRKIKEWDLTTCTYLPKPFGSLLSPRNFDVDSQQA